MFEPLKVYCMFPLRSKKTKTISELFSEPHLICVSQIKNAFITLKCLFSIIQFEIKRCLSLVSLFVHELYFLPSLEMIRYVVTVQSPIISFICF